MDKTRQLILDTLSERAGTKQDVYEIMNEIFGNLKKCLQEISVELGSEITKKDKSIKVDYRDRNANEAEIWFSGDILTFTMHTNVFNFPVEHAVQQSAYVKENPLRAYCGMIEVYNFLADSVRFNRTNDRGYLIARIFVNKERNFFVEGKRQLGFLYNDFGKYPITNDLMKAIIDSSILYALDFDLWAPNYDDVKEITLAEKLKETANLNHGTGKRLGFQFSKDANK